MESHLRMILPAWLSFAALFACAPAEPVAPPALTAPQSFSVRHGDTNTAVENARAVLAEMAEQENRRLDPAALGVALIEGIVNEDPEQIGAALTRIAQRLPLKPSREVSR